MMIDIDRVCMALYAHRLQSDYIYMIRIIHDITIYYIYILQYKYIERERE